MRERLAGCNWMIGMREVALLYGQGSQDGVEEEESAFWGGKSKLDVDSLVLFLEDTL